jgi:hypothetical protein
MASRGELLDNALSKTASQQDHQASLSGKSMEMDDLETGPQSDKQADKPQGRPNQRKRGSRVHRDPIDNYAVHHILQG